MTLRRCQEDALSTIDNAGYRDRLLAITLHLRETEATASTASATLNAILASAISLFTRKGYSGTSVREIAASVGIKAASLYAHCPGGKEQMLRMGLHNILSQFLAYITQEIRFEWPAQKQLSSVFERHIMWQLEFGDQALAWDAAINQFGVVGVLDDEALAAIRAEQALYHDYLDDLVATVTGDPDSGDTATALRVMCDQAPAWVETDSPSKAEIEDAIARLRGLAARLLDTPSF